MGYELISLEKDQAVATITINRPPLNIMNIAMMNEINSALDEIASEDGLKILLFRATGKAFSAGVDVGEHLGDKVTEMIDVFHGIFKRLSNLDLVSIAAVQGAALGGGCELAIYCDMVIASEKAKFGQPEIQVGVFPPIAALIFPRIMGRKKALELILSGDTISAKDACEIGLINKVVPHEKFDEEVNNFVSKFSKLSGIVLKLTKKACISGLLDKEDEGLTIIEDIYLNKLMKTKDAEEGLTAFLEKRKPIWKDE